MDLFTEGGVQSFNNKPVVLNSEVIRYEDPQVATSSAYCLGVCFFVSISLQNYLSAIDSLTAK